MPHAPRPARTMVRRALATAACACVAFVLASCGSDSKPTVPLVSTSAPPGPMMTLTGVPRVSFNVQGFISRIVPEDTLSGYFYVTLSDSIGRHVFVADVTLDGVSMRPETSGGGAPNRYSLRPVDLGPAYHTKDVLQFAITDTSGLTEPFTVEVEPSTFDLAPDSTVYSRRRDLTVHWNGSAELVSLQLADELGTTIVARLSFTNETGVSQLLVRSQDLANLVPGRLSVGSSLTNSETFVTATNKRLTASLIVNEGRSWQLAP